MSHLWHHNGRGNIKNTYVRVQCCSYTLKWSIVNKTRLIGRSKCGLFGSHCMSVHYMLGLLSVIWSILYSTIAIYSFWTATSAHRILVHKWFILVHYYVCKLLLISAHCFGTSFTCYCIWWHTSDWCFSWSTVHHWVRQIRISLTLSHAWLLCSYFIVLILVFIKCISVFKIETCHCCTLDWRMHYIDF